MQQQRVLMKKLETDGVKPPVKSELDLLLTRVGEHADRQAFTAVFEKVAPRLKSFLRGQKQPESEIEVILQETMLKVWRRASTFDRSKSSAITWIYTVARNVKIDRLRKMSRPEPDQNDPSFIPAPPETGEQVVDRQQRSEILKRAVSLLPEDQKTIIMMSFFEEKPHAEIAEELGIPLGTVKSRIRLAFGKIRSELENLK